MCISLWDFACRQEGGVPSLQKASRILCFIIGSRSKQPPYLDISATREGHERLGERLRRAPNYFYSLGLREDRVRHIAQQLRVEGQKLKGFLDSNDFDWTWGTRYNPGRDLRSDWFRKIIEDVDPTGPDCDPFAGLPNETHQPIEHYGQEPFGSLIDAIDQEIRRIPQQFSHDVKLGSASWSGSDERVRKWLDSDDLTIWKLIYFGRIGNVDKDYSFGIRIRYARQFQALAKPECWDFRFQVPPNYGDHQWFVGFSVRADEQSLARIRKVADTIIASPIS